MAVRAATTRLKNGGSGGSKKSIPDELKKKRHDNDRIHNNLSNYMDRPQNPMTWFPTILKMGRLKITYSPP